MESLSVGSSGYANISCVFQSTFGFFWNIGQIAGPFTCFCSPQDNFVSRQDTFMFVHNYPLLSDSTCSATVLILLTSVKILINSSK